jgi:hypothetical protein
MLLTAEAPFDRRVAVRAVEDAAFGGFRLLVVNAVSGVVLPRSMIARRDSPLAESGWIACTEPVRLAAAFGVEVVVRTLLAPRPREALVRHALAQPVHVVHFAPREGYIRWRECRRWERDIERAGLAA